MTKDELLKQIYSGCWRHFGQFSPVCLDCGIAARGVLSEVLTRHEKRIAALEKKWEERLNGNFDPAPTGTPRGEIYTTNKADDPDYDALVDETGNIIRYIRTHAGEVEQDAVPTPEGSDQQSEQREDSLRWGRGREITYGSGLLPDEGGTG